MSYTFIKGVIFAFVANINKLIGIIYNIIVKKQAKEAVSYACFLL